MADDGELNQSLRTELRGGLHMFFGDYLQMERVDGTFVKTHVEVLQLLHHNGIVELIAIWTEPTIRITFPFLYVEVYTFPVESILPAVQQGLVSGA